MKYKNKIFLIILSLAFSLFLSACGTNAKSDVLTLNLANGGAIGDDRDLSIHEFAKLVDEKSNGKIKINIYSGGSLGGWRDTIEGLELGITHIVVESIGTLEAFSATAAIDAYPFLFKNYDQYLDMIYGEYGKSLMETVGNEGGFKLMGPSNRGPRVMTTTVPIHNIDDLQGVKLRAPGTPMYMKTWQYLGAAPIPMDPSEIYTGIQQGTVSGQENPVFYSFGSAMYDVCDYMILTNHVFSTDVYIMDQQFFNSLTGEQQQILEECALAAGLWRTEYVIEKEQETINEFRERGVEVIEPELEGFRAKLVNFSDEFPHLKPWVEKVKEKENEY